MDNQIICPHCGKSVPITEALTHQLKAKFDIKMRDEQAKMAQLYRKRLEEEKQKIMTEQAAKDQEREAQLRRKVQTEMELKLTDTKNESEELRKKNKEFQSQLIEMNKVVRQLKAQDDQRQLEMEKKLAAEQQRIRISAQKRADEEYHLKLAEKDKKLDDVLKTNEELRRKLEQGSQQAQGEVLELDIEDKLRHEFPYDDIREVPKGIRGADLIQTIKNKFGQECGTIVWEFKRTKAWSNEFIPKLKDDQRQLKAEVAALISDVLPPEISIFGVKDNVWIGGYQTVLGLAYVLRKSILEVAAIRQASGGRKEKMHELWEYLTSVEFKQRIEVIIETFSALQKDIEKERRWFMGKWEKQEKTLRKVIDNTAGMYGGLQHIMGKALPQVTQLEAGEPEEAILAAEPTTDEAASLF